MNQQQNQAKRFGKTLDKCDFDSDEMEEYDREYQSELQK